MTAWDVCGCKWIWKQRQFMLAILSFNLSLIVLCKVNLRSTYLTYLSALILDSLTLAGVTTREID